MVTQPRQTRQEQPQAMVPTRRWPLVLTLEPRDTVIDTDARIFNGLLEKSQQQQGMHQQPDITVRKRYGWSIDTTYDPPMTVQLGLGIVNAFDSIISIVGRDDTTAALLFNGVDQNAYFLWTKDPSGAPIPFAFSISLGDDLCLVFHDTGHLFTWNIKDGLIDRSLTAGSQDLPQNQDNTQVPITGQISGGAIPVGSIVTVYATDQNSPPDKWWTTPGVIQVTQPIQSNNWTAVMDLSSFGSISQDPSPTITFRADVDSSASWAAGLTQFDLISANGYTLKDVTGSLTDIPGSVSPYTTGSATFTKMFTIDSSTNSLQNMAPLVPGLAYLNGITYVMDETGHIYGSGVNDLGTWDPLNMLMAQVEPDFAVYLGKQMVYILAFKEWSVEVFYDAGNPTGSSLAPVLGAKLSIGCASAQTVVQIEGAYYFVGQSAQGGRGVWGIDNLKPMNFSNPAIERLITEDELEGVTSWGGRVHGHRFYGLNLHKLMVSLVLDIDNQVWYQWALWSEGMLPWMSTTLGSAGRMLVQHGTTGQIGFMDLNKWTDWSGDFIFGLITPPVDNDTRNRKVMTKMELVGDQLNQGVVSVNFFDDDMISSNGLGLRTLDMSTRHSILTNCGTYRKRNIELVTYDDKPLRIKAIEYTILEGTF